MSTHVYAVGADQTCAGWTTLGHATLARRKQLPGAHAMPAPTTRRPEPAPPPLGGTSPCFSGSLGPAPLHSLELTARVDHHPVPLGPRGGRDRGSTGTAGGGLPGPQSERTQVRPQAAAQGRQTGRTQPTSRMQKTAVSDLQFTRFTKRVGVVLADPLLAPQTWARPPGQPV